MGEFKPISRPLLNQSHIAGEIMTLNCSNGIGLELNAGFNNKVLGTRIKQRRLELNLTQTKLGNALNVSFQQIQKYEKGTNGISAVRILHLSNYLEKPVHYFFEGYDSYDQSPSR